MKEVIKKSGYTVGILAVILILGLLPVLGVNSTYSTAFFQKGDMLTFLDTMTGGALGKMSFTGFGITSYISASIFLQLLGLLCPPLEKMRADGEKGRRLYEKIEFAVAIVLTIVSGSVLAITFGKTGLLVEYSLANIIVAVVSWTVGSALVIKLAKSIQNRGIGNGISMVLALNVLSRVPDYVKAFAAKYVSGKELPEAVLAVVIAGGILFLVVFLAVYMCQGHINIPIEQTQKDASVLNETGHLSISSNVANVLPVIYATTLLSLPSVIMRFAGVDVESGIGAKLVESSSMAKWFHPNAWYHVVGLAVYILLVFGLGFFTSQMSFCSQEIAHTLKMRGAVIPGIAPGDATIAYFEKGRKLMTIVNIVLLLIISSIPAIAGMAAGLPSVAYLGTSLVIIVNVAFDTIARIRGAYLPYRKIKIME